jgi:hypothetical protein
LGHGCEVPVLYGDDGEMQCNALLRHGALDFRRDDLVELWTALRGMYLADIASRTARAEAADAALTERTQERDEARKALNRYQGLDEHGEPVIHDGSEWIRKVQQHSTRAALLQAAEDLRVEALATYVELRAGMEEATRWLTARAEESGE